MNVRKFASQKAKYYLMDLPIRQQDGSDTRFDPHKNIVLGFENDNLVRTAYRRYQHIWDIYNPTINN